MISFDKLKLSRIFITSIIRLNTQYVAVYVLGFEIESESDVSLVFADLYLLECVLCNYVYYATNTVCVGGVMRYAVGYAVPWCSGVTVCVCWWVCQGGYMVLLCLCICGYLYVSGVSVYRCSRCI